MEAQVSRRAFVGGMVAAAALVGAHEAMAEEGDVARGAALDADEELECDVLVVGAGMSGLAACVQAADLGARVICLEGTQIVGGGTNGVEGVFGVNSKIQQDQGIQVAIGDLIRTELEQNQYRNSGIVLHDLVHDSGEDIDWLVEQGVRFGVVDNYVGFHPIFHWFETKTGAESYVVPMQARAEELGVRFVMGAHADQLIQGQDGAVCGAIASTDGGSIRVSARAVILATGGYAERMDYLADFGYTEENTAPGGSMGGDGSGHDMAVSIGAASNRANTGILGGATVPEMPQFYEGGYFCSVMNSLSNIPWVVWVNQDGERFCNEDLSLSNHMVSGNPVRMYPVTWIIMDGSMMDEYVAGDEQGLTELADGLQRGVIYEAQGWDALAEATGMDADALRATVESYNAGCAAGSDDDFGKDAQYMRALATEGTVYAVSLKGSVGKTMGALKTGRDFHVLDETGAPIEGLYAIGTEGAMIWANVYTMNISGSCAAHNVYSGRIAAQNAVNGL